MTQDNPMVGDPAPDPTHQFYSLGFLCQQLQALPDRVEAIGKSAGVEPAMYVDGIAYWRGNDVVAMAQHVAKLRAEVEGLRQSAPLN